MKSLKTKLNQFEDDSEAYTNFDKNLSIFLPFKDIPEVGMHYLRHFRNVEVQNSIFKLLTEQLEFAKLKESKDTPSVQIIDVAVPPVRKSSPKRMIIVVIATFTGLLFSSGVAFTFEHINRLGSKSDVEKDKIDQIRHLMNKNKET